MPKSLAQLRTKKVSLSKAGNFNRAEVTEEEWGLLRRAVLANPNFDENEKDLLKVTLEKCVAAFKPRILQATVVIMDIIDKANSALEQMGSEENHLSIMFFDEWSFTKRRALVWLQTYAPEGANLDEFVPRTKIKNSK